MHAVDLGLIPGLPYGPTTSVRSNPWAQSLEAALGVGPPNQVKITVLGGVRQVEGVVSAVLVVSALPRGAPYFPS